MRSAKALLVIGLLAASAMATRAADLSVILKTSTGEPVRDAVVSYRPATGGAPVKTSGRYEMVQEDIQFHPFVLVAPAGSDVVFPNHDRVRHHVYSFSPAKRFELKLYGREETRSVHFDKPGVVAIGCNIHDSMIAYIDVVDTPYAAKTDDKGRVTLTGVPVGPGQLTLWQPYLRAPKNEQTRSLTVGANGASENLTLDLRPAAPAMTH